MGDTVIWDLNKSMALYNSYSDSEIGTYCEYSVADNSKGANYKVLNNVRYNNIGTINANAFSLD